MERWLLRLVRALWWMMTMTLTTAMAADYVLLGASQLTKTTDGVTINCTQTRDAMRLAQRDILDSQYLGDKTFDFCFVDTQAATTAALQGTVECIDANANAVGIIGESKSEISIAIQNIAVVFELPQISYDSTSSVLSDKTRYPYFFRTVSGDQYQAPVVAQLISDFGWGEVAVIYDATSYGQSLYNAFADRASKIGIIVTIASILPLDFNEDNVAPVLNNVIQTNTQVVVVFGYSSVCELVFRLAFEAGALNDGYHYWVSADGLFAYTIANIHNAYGIPYESFQGILSTSQYPGGGANYDNFLAEWNAYVNGTPSEFPPMAPVFPFVYDAVWMMAVAMKALLDQGIDPLSHRPELRDELFDVQYNGITGLVKFDEHGDRSNPIYQINNYYNGDFHRVGFGYVTTKGPDEFEFSVDLDDSLLVFPDGTNNIPTVVVRCLAGDYFDTKSRQCKPCNPGYNAPIKGMTWCLACPSGTYANLPAASDCSLCSPGTATSHNASSECEKCSTTSYQDQPGSIECKSCPPNSSTNVLGSSDIRDCVCLEGFYNATPDYYLADGCLACPEGAVCAGRYAFPTPAPGYFARSSEPLVFYKCEYDYTCPGGGVDVCAFPHSGDLCADCVDSMFSLNGQCYECSASAFVIFLFVLVIVIAVYVSYCNSVSNQKYFETSKTTAITTNFSILIVYLQINAVIASFAIQWPPELEKFFSLFHFANMNIDITEQKCLTLSSQSLLVGYTLTMLIPVALPFMFGLFYVLDKIHYVFVTYYGCEQFGSQYMKKKRKWKSFSGSFWPLSIRRAKAYAEYVLYRRLAKYQPMEFYAVMNSSLQYLDFFYISLINTCLQFWNCYQHPNGEWSMHDHSSLFCHGETWKKYLPSNIVFLTLYGLMIPVAMGAVLWGSRKLPLYEKNYPRQKFLLEPYKKRMYYWRLIIIAKKLVFSILAVSLSSLSSISLQITMTFLATFVFLMLNITLRPYKFSSNTNLETAMLVSHVLTLLLALIIDSSAGTDQYLGMSIFVLVVIALSCAIAVVAILLNVVVLFRGPMLAKDSAAKQQNFEEFDALFHDASDKEMFGLWGEQLCDDDRASLHSTVSRYLRFRKHAQDGKLKVWEEMKLEDEEEENGYGYEIEVKKIQR